MFDDKNRFRVIIGLIIAIIVALFVRLIYLQGIKGEEYYEQVTHRLNSTFSVKAPRGKITDRYGKPLVTNRLGYSIKLKKTDATNDEINRSLLNVVNVLLECGYSYSDTLPISEYPYEFTFIDENMDGSSEDEKAKWFSQKKKITKDMSATAVLEYYRDNVYNISDDYSPNEVRKIVGIRYDADMSEFSALYPYTIYQDVNVDVITKIKERQKEFKGIEIEKEYFRVYNEGDLAAHILGGIGKIGMEEYETLKDSGYGYNDLIGKRGVEKEYEKYLKGEDGVESEDEDIKQKTPKAGDYLVLTLDTDLQRAAEESLERRITDIAKSGGDPKEKKGGDADAGAVVVLEVNSGAVLACANYPSYDPARFNADYKALIENPANPIWNRAISGGYAPGSTFKPLVALAALEDEAVTMDELITCEGIYKFYEDYQPKCWIWSSGKNHGDINVTDAIKYSCNCYFYEAGRRVGIDAINAYAKKFGLGSVTGIDLAGEEKGNISNPEYKKKIEKENQKWYPADTIITAIGQSYSYFTPIQLANYIATIANGGTLYKTHLLKSIRSTADGDVVVDYEPEVMGQVDISPENLEAVKWGMYGVVDEGSASGIFENYSIPIGGKTGTAQVGKNVSDNALFVAFAPFDKPEIAVAVVIEHGVKGENAALVARDIFDEYFRRDFEVGVLDIEGELLP